MKKAVKASCQVEGCPASLASLRSYFQRQKICEEHAKAEAIPSSSGLLRFCQQCTKLEPLASFEGSKRSCRASLMKRHDRHRQRVGGRRSRAAHTSASSDGSEDYSPHSDSSLRRASSMLPSTSATPGLLQRMPEPPAQRPGPVLRPSAQRLGQPGLGLPSAPPPPWLAPGTQGGKGNDLEALVNTLLGRPGLPAQALVPAADGGLPGLPSVSGSDLGSGAPAWTTNPFAAPATAAEQQQQQREREQQDLASIFDGLCSEASRGAAAAASAAAAAQLLVQPPQDDADVLRQLARGLQVLQTLQAQVLQHMKAIVEKAAQRREGAAGLSQLLLSGLQQLLPPPGSAQQGAEPLHQALQGTATAQLQQQLRQLIGATSQPPAGSSAPGAQQRPEQPAGSGSPAGARAPQQAAALPPGGGAGGGRSAVQEQVQAVAQMLQQRLQQGPQGALGSEMASTSTTVPANGATLPYSLAAAGAMQPDKAAAGGASPPARPSPHGSPVAGKPAPPQQQLQQQQPPDSAAPSSGAVEAAQGAAQQQQDQHQKLHALLSRLGGSLAEAARQAQEQQRLAAAPSQAQHKPAPAQQGE